MRTRKRSSRATSTRILLNGPCPTGAITSRNTRSMAGSTPHPVFRATAARITRGARNATSKNSEVAFCWFSHTHCILYRLQRPKRAVTHQRRQPHNSVSGAPVFLMPFLTVRLHFEVPSHKLKQPLIGICGSRYQCHACCASGHKHREHLHVYTCTFVLCRIPNRPSTVYLFKEYHYRGRRTLAD